MSHPNGRWRYTPGVDNLFAMSTLGIDTYKLLAALRGTGKSANFTAEEIANAVNVAQEGAELLTKPDFAVGMSAFDAKMARFEAGMDGFAARMDGFAVRMDAFDARMDAFEQKLDAKLEAIRADIKAEVKASQVQNFIWLSGIMLASNGMVIALLARLTHVI